MLDASNIKNPTANNHDSHSHSLDNHGFSFSPSPDHLLDNNMPFLASDNLSDDETADTLYRFPSHLAIHAAIIDAKAHGNIETSQLGAFVNVGSYKEPVKDIVKLMECLNEVAPDSHNNEDEDKARALPLETFTDQDQVTVFQEARIDEIIDEADTSIIRNEADKDPPNNIDKTIINSTTENTTSRQPSIEP